MIKTRSWDAVLAPTMDRRGRRLQHAGHGGGAPKRVDQTGCVCLHEMTNPIIGTKAQALSSDVRICDYRSNALEGKMDLEEIKLRMADQGYRQVDLANLLDLVPNKISKAFSGERRFTVGEMDKIRAWLGDQQQVDRDRVRMLPVIGEVAAGRWKEATRSTTDVMPSPDPNLPANAFALDVAGDSMDHFVQEGGRVIVDPDDKALYPRRFYVVLNDEGETTFKRFFADPARLEPCSSNDAHKPLIIGQGGTFSIVGRVIWQASRLPD